MQDRKTAFEDAGTSVVKGDEYSRPRQLNLTRHRPKEISKRNRNIMLCNGRYLPSEYILVTNPMIGQNSKTTSHFCQVCLTSSMLELICFTAYDAVRGHFRRLSIILLPRHRRNHLNVRLGRKRRAKRDTVGMRVRRGDHAANQRYGTSETGLTEIAFLISRRATGRSSFDKQSIAVRRWNRA